LERHPDVRGEIAYIRASGGRAGKRAHLDQTTIGIECGIRNVTGRDVVESVAHVESGDIRGRRKWLKKAARLAEQLGCRVVARDLSRFIRPARYYDHGDTDAVPTVQEMEQLQDMVHGVPLATLIDPQVTASARRGEVIRLAGGGRPRGTSEQERRRIVQDLRTMSQQQAADKHGVSVRTVKRIKARSTKGQI
jgi:hypothetical protein